MAKRAAYTLLFITPDLLVRADFGPLPQTELLGFWQRPQSGNVRLYYSIEAAMELGGKCGSTVWVIGEEFWTQTLSLPASAVAGLGKEQIGKAIGFDVEALTGIAGSDSALGFCSAGPADESEHFWVTQVTTLARTQIQKSIETTGGVLAGLVHPGGLPARVAPGTAKDNDSRSWRRIEVWKDTTLCITAQPDGPRRIKVINGDPTQDAWRASVSRWINSNPAEISEWLGPRGSMAGESLGGNAEPWTALPALKNDVLKEWLVRWASELAGGAKNVPAVTASRSTAFTAKHLRAAAVLAVICLAACIGRGVWLTRQQEAAVVERDAAEAPAHQMEELKKKAASLAADLVKQRTLNANIKRPVTHDPADIERQRLRLEGLLTALAEDADSTLVIDHLASESAGTVVIEGQSLRSISVDDFTRRLAAVLPARGWDITPAQKLTPEGLSVGGPCQFRLRVTPVSPPGSVAAPSELVAVHRHGDSQ